VKTSPKRVTTPEEKSSFSVSTSDVTRVISRPPDCGRRRRC
jgi:hypothetical protein